MRTEIARWGNSLAVCACGSRCWNEGLQRAWRSECRGRIRRGRPSPTRPRYDIDKLTPASRRRTCRKASTMLQPGVNCSDGHAQPRRSRLDRLHAECRAWQAGRRPSTGAVATGIPSADFLRGRVSDHQHDQGLSVRSRSAGRPADLRRRVGRSGREHRSARPAHRVRRKGAGKRPQDVQARIGPSLGLG